MPPTTSAVAVSAARQRAVLAAVCASTVLVIGLVAAINLAVPVLAGSGLHPGPAQLLWIVDAYVVFFACLVLPAGAIGDRFGRKGALLSGLAVFAAGAVLSAAAPTVGVLLAGRAITGAGAALVLPNGLAVLVHATRPERRSRALATWAAMTGVGGLAGNVGGGALLTAGSWRLLFTLVVPPAVVLLAWIAVAAPRSTRTTRPVDPPGALLLTAATVTLVLGTIEGPERGWGSAVVLSSFALSAVLWVLWVVAGLRARHPLLDPRLFRRPALTAGCVGLLLAFFGNFGLFYVNASLLQYVHGLSVLEAGVGILPMSVPLLVLPRFVPGLVTRFGIPRVLAAAFAVVSAGLFGLSQVADGSYPAYACCLFVIGTGMAPALPALTVEITGALPHEQAGVGGGLQSATRELGSALGVAVVGTITTQASGGAGTPTVSAALAADPAHRDAITAAYAHAASFALEVTSALVLVAGAVTAGLSLRAARSPRIEHREGSPRHEGVEAGAGPPGFRRRTGPGGTVRGRR